MLTLTYQNMDDINEKDFIPLHDDKPRITKKELVELIDQNNIDELSRAITFYQIYPNKLYNLF